jgi:hypothetical protein
LGLVLVLGLTVILSCSGSDSTGPTRFDGTEDEQRYQVLRGMMVSMLDECCMAQEEGLDAFERIDSVRIPGIDWPVRIPAAIATDVLVRGSYVELAQAYVDDSTQITSSSSLSRSSDEVRLSLRYSYYENPTVGPAEHWLVSLAAILTNHVEDTVRVLLSFNATHKISGLCQQMTCERYSITINYWMVRGRRLEVIERVDGDNLSGVIEEIATSAYFDSDVQVRWYLRGDMMPGARFDLVTLSGPFSARDTIPLCP